MTKARRKGSNLTCRACGTVFYAAFWDIQRGRKYCTHKCSEIGAGAYVTSEGYIKVLLKEHPRADKYGFVYEHLIVMEKHLGRYVKRGEVVHHLDGNRSNNSLPNLQLLDSQSAHFRLHKVWEYAGARGKDRLKKEFDR